MNNQINITQSFKWVFSTTILRRIVSFLLFLYLVRVFSRSDLGIYRTFVLILSFSTMITTFSFNILNVVEKSQKYLKHSLQFIFISSIIISILLFFLKGVLANKYSSPDLFLYLLYGFWLVVPLSLKKIIKSLYELEMKFRFLSIVETINLFVYVILTLLLFLIDLKFYYFIIAFYIGEIVEIILMYFPVRKILSNALYDVLKFKYIKPLIICLKDNFAFLSLTTAPSTLNMFIAEAPILLMGLFFLPEFIGNYFIAAQLVTVPISFLTVSLCQVLFPAFSLIDKEKLPHKIDEYIKYVVYVMWLPILIFGILLKYFGYLITGEQDIHLIVSMIIVLIIKTLFHLILNPLSTVPTVLRKPQYELYWSIGSISAVCGIIYFLRAESFLNMFYGYALINILSLLIFILMILKMVSLSLKSFFHTLWKGFIYIFPLIVVLFLPESVKMGYGMAFFSIGMVYSMGMFYIFEKKFLGSFWKRIKV